MKQRIFEKFYWQSRRDRVSTNLALYIGNQLIHGENLCFALLKASNEIDNKRQKYELLKAANLIKNGELIINSPYYNEIEQNQADVPEQSDSSEAIIIRKLKKELFGEEVSLSQEYIYETAFRKINISKKDKFILSLPITDLIKGKILKNWSESKYHGSNIINYIYICIVVSIFAFASMPIFPFVVPQFYEILSGIGGVDKTSILNSAIRLSYSQLYQIIPIIVIVFIIFVIISCHLLSSVRKMQEEADFLALLSSVNKEDQFNVLDLAVDKKTFPIYYKKLRIILEKMKNGEPVEVSSINSGLSSYLLWFLQLGFYDRDRTAIKEGSIMLNERIMLRSMSAIKVTEVLVVVIQSIVFLLFAFLLYGSNNEILLRCIAE